MPIDADEIEEGWRLLAVARETAAHGPAWAIILRQDTAEHWLYAHADALFAAAAERDALAREAAQLREEVAVLCDEDQRKLLELERLRRAVALALDGPSDSEIGMETTLGRLNRIERQLRAAVAPQEGDGNGR